MITYGANQIFSEEEYTEEDIETLLIRGKVETDKLNSKIDKKIKETLDLDVQTINIYEFFKDEENAKDLETIN